MKDNPDFVPQDRGWVGIGFAHREILQREATAILKYMRFHTDLLSAKTFRTKKRFLANELVVEVSKRRLEPENVRNCVGGIYLKMIGRRPKKILYT